MNRNLRTILIAVFGILVFLGCASQKSEVKAWQDISSLDQLVGKWEGSTYLNVPKNEEDFMPETSVEVNISVEYIKGSQDFVLSMKMDFDRLLNDMIKMGLEAGASEEDLSKDILWEEMVKNFEEEDDDEASSSGQYYFSYVISEDAETILYDEDGKFQINENGSQIKILFLGETLTLGLGDEGFSEIILNKK